MDCPSCSNELVRTKYEGLPVFHCNGCFGYLIARRRMEGVKRSREKSVADLKKETTEESQVDSQETLKCPRCRQSMKKDFLKEPASFHIDVCDECEMVWFDGGELARFQLAWEASEKGRDSAEMQRRMREMSPEAKAEMDANIQKLPEPESPLWGGLFEAFVEAFFTRGRYRWK